MKLTRPRWRSVVIALAVIAAVAVAVPAFGISGSIKKAIRKEVARQISKATGPQGPAGANGAAGTARAYARVISHAADPCTGGASGDECTIDRNRGISAAHRTAVGQYCVIVPGISSADVAAVTSVDWLSTTGPEGNAQTETSGNCMGTGFLVRSERHNDLNGTNATEVDDVGFNIIVP